MDRSNADAELSGDLLLSHSAEESHLDDHRASRITSIQTFERSIEGLQIELVVGSLDPLPGGTYHQHVLGPNVVPAPELELMGDDLPVEPGSDCLGDLLAVEDPRPGTGTALRPDLASR